LNGDHAGAEALAVRGVVRDRDGRGACGEVDVHLQLALDVEPLGRRRSPAAVRGRREVVHRLLDAGEDLVL
jgi:hypothetical protein